MAQYDQIMLFYNQLLNMADEIHDLIQKNMFDEILDKLNYHDKVFIQLKLAKKCTTLTEEEQKEIDAIEEELRQKEKHNIELLQHNMRKVKKELDGLNFKSKVKKAYGQISENETKSSILDIDDSYRPEK